MSEEQEPAGRITSHQLARILLSLPDLPVIQQNDCIDSEVCDAWVDDEASWASPDGWKEGIAIKLSDEDCYCLPGAERRMKA